MNNENQLYRVMQHAIVDVLFDAYGQADSHKLIRAAGFKAGMTFAKSAFDLSNKLFLFIRHLQKTFKELRIGTLKVEKASADNVEFTLDCSEHMRYAYATCCYGEGLLAGIMETYIKEKNSGLSSYVIRLSM